MSKKYALATIAAATLALLGVAGVASSAGAATTTPVPLTTSPPTPPPCPPALPIGGMVDSTTATSVTIRYSLLFSPPCGYDLPITVNLFVSRDDAAQWRDPVASADSGMERHGTVVVEGLTPDTEYWFRFSDPQGRRDPYIIGGPARTQAVAAPVCAATATIGSGWGSGFVATVTVRNTGTEALDGWRVSWTWPGDQRIQSLWNGTLTEAGGEVTVRDAGWNGRLAPGGSTTFGLLATTTSVPEGFALDCGR
ncbi:cellulose-binding domain-containing protein [Micromonospora craniellae]|uniref:Endoglucanase n=1 Tax=Micromonospora craniellae TaxID=2294034 RepID=A0A372G1L8_9ACTN|nr:cellulose-binding domain-containing protein [Micromonospora craniellae]QOC92814.1 cellulose binding domain-containing protein [Micromonospora craniellae]RFS46957.1 endoglucanase [Micromonospora craniellae]